MLRAHVEATFKALKKPEDWKIVQCCLQHKSGIELWTANGRGYLKIYRPIKMRFTFTERYILWPVVEEVLCTLAAAQYEETSDA